MDTSALAGPVKHLPPGTVAVLGVPSDVNSSFLRGAALAPARIRHVLYAGSMNLCAENGIDLGADRRLQDLGDLELEGHPAPFERIENAVTDLLAQGVYVLSLGGDHAITYPIIRAFAKHYPGLNILHLDAHPDLYDEYGGSRISHACPFARIMEEELATRLVQVGIRAMNPHQRAQAKRFGVHVIEMRQWRPGLVVQVDGPLYISLDLDAFDPAFVPGVSHHEPGGISPRDAIELIQSLQVPIVGADIVEFNPKRDLVDLTASVAAKLLKEIAACMLHNNPAVS